MAMKIRITKKKQTESRPNITSITLGGFQVFDEPTTIPLSRLTFLFGPNSAGKSAVEDGLVLLSEALNSRTDNFFISKPSNRFEGLKKHWRRINGGEESLAPRLTLGISATLPTNLQGVLLDFLGRPKKSKNSQFDHETSITLTFPLFCEARNLYCRAGLIIDVSFDRVDLFRFESERGFSINLLHPLFEGVNLKFDYRQVSNPMPDWIDVGLGWVDFKSKNTFIDEKWNITRSLYFMNDDYDENQQALTHIGPAFEEAAGVFNLLVTTILGNINVHASLVNASRTIPTETQLTHLVTSHLEDRFYWEDLLPLFGVNSKDDEDFYGLAESFVNFSFKIDVNNDALENAKLIVQVNRALSDHLFIERGYRLEAQYLLTLSPAQLPDLEFPDSEDAGSYPLLVHIGLIDSAGRRFTFDEVGSGLGYVLPVLCSAFERNSTSLIQQPELHLHPALQSALGDVLIEALGKDKQLIVETHSEHLLLRVLKRIRQSNSKKPPPPELRLNPEDVSIVYFDPSPDGTTSVKRLRISPEGDFLDMWPRGFFAERDEELFDE